MITLGPGDDVRLRLYAVSAERKVKHPAVVEILEKAKKDLFASPGEGHCLLRSSSHAAQSNTSDK